MMVIMVVIMRKMKEMMMKIMIVIMKKIAK